MTNTSAMLPCFTTPAPLFSLRVGCCGRYTSNWTAPRHGVAKLVTLGREARHALDSSVSLHLHAHSDNLEADDLFADSECENGWDTKFPTGTSQPLGSDDDNMPRNVRLRAPNGMPDDVVTDFMPELLPLMAEQENEAARSIGENEEHVRRILRNSISRVASSHRSSKRLGNLKPFKLRKENEKVCQACHGTGMTVCEYCKGEGFVDLGENGNLFESKIGDNEVLMPKHVMGNIYHCPLCGGLQKERCTTCFGLGEDPSFADQEQPRGAAQSPMVEQAWKLFDLDQLTEEEQQRVEVGIDGLIILRAKPRKKRSNNGKKTKKKDAKPVSAKRARGRPTKQQKRTDEISNATDLSRSSSRGQVGELNVSKDAPSVSGRRMVSKASRVGRSTDFVNTTDYQVGRRLRKQNGRPSKILGPPIRKEDEEEH